MSRRATSTLSRLAMCLTVPGCHRRSRARRAARCRGKATTTATPRATTKRATSTQPHLAVRPTAQAAAAEAGLAVSSVAARAAAGAGRTASAHRAATSSGCAHGGTYGFGCVVWRPVYSGHAHRVEFLCVFWCALTRRAVLSRGGACCAQLGDGYCDSSCNVPEWCGAVAFLRV